MKPEDKELWNHLNELFDIAWDMNNKKGTPTELSTKILVYFPSIMQQFSYLCDTIEEEEIEEIDIDTFTYGDEKRAILVTAFKLNEVIRRLNNGK